MCKGVKEQSNTKIIHNDKHKEKHKVIKRKITYSVKKQIAGKQYNKCANNPNIILAGLSDYKCPLWQNIDIDIRGCFDESGYEIDHIVEFSLTNNDDISNLQALCKSCHTVKTKNFNRKYNTN